METWEGTTLRVDHCNQSIKLDALYLINVLPYERIHLDRE